MRYVLITLLLLFQTLPTVGQKVIEPNHDSIRLAGISRKLAVLAIDAPSYAEEIDISVGKMPLSDMLRNIARVGKVNLNVKGAEKTMVTSNFSRARITDLLYFLCKEYDLDVDIVGNIVAIHPVAPRVVKPKEPQVEYTIATNGLSYNIQEDKLIDVTKKITALTGTNILIHPQMYSRQISGFVSNMKQDEAIEALATLNGLTAKKTDNGAWDLSVPENTQGHGVNLAAGARGMRHRSPYELEIDSLGSITAQIPQGSIRDILVDLCERQSLNYYFISAVDQHTSLFVRDVGFETLLSVMFAGTQFSYYVENGIYFFGASSREHSLTSVRVVAMRYRSVNKVEEMIPEPLKEGLNLRTFPDLNSIIASGDQKAVARVETFLRSIDKRVPQVTIEVIIVDVTKSEVMEAGINMGLGNSPARTSGSLSPGVNMNFSSASVNNLINSFNGFGSVNLGKVSSDFYLSLKLLEENGNIELRSTPKLSTLNGHEATLKSGETRYYKEIINTYMGSQNPMQTEAYTWKNIDANLNIKITPFISEDNHITLDIEIEQTEFTTSTPAATNAKEQAPPGTATRSFKSLIRVQNEDMVLLGGIDRNSKDKTSKGLPFIARVPVLRWFFGNSKNNKHDQKLNVFIKPTIID